LIHRDTAGLSMIRPIEDRLAKGGMWVRICFDERDRMKNGFGFIVVDH
jgi:hypothetical protein